MKLLIDTNVFLDIFLSREQFVADAKRLFVMKQFRDAVHGSKRMQDILREVSPLLNVCSIDHTDISHALSAQWEDFEDCLIWRAAKKIKADYIVTRNTRDFAQSDIPALTPSELFSTIKSDLHLVYDEVGF